MVSSAAAVREALAKQQWDLITSDFAMPGFDGLSALAIVREHGLDVPFILVSGKIGEERAIEANAPRRDRLRFEADFAFGLQATT